MVDNVFEIRDIVKYKTFMNPNENWGVIVEILNVEDSIHQESKGIKLYKVNPLDRCLSCDFIEEKNIIQSYSKYYERNEV